ncbi:hypothetical protein HNQ79_001068 [Streptomyces candidus]|uniref:Uncharacterized protein n=1 Tax=Streptomyces candidus TaxID=67283 RepID=A0A7X0HBI7_9ACTN|nr:hypothetical protein [Streptomyces candidus]GHH36035.1 hypothetical protein GCM10018773_10340 [Streptomyces candidus]
MSLAGLAAEHGARLIIVNGEPTPYDALADEVVREPIGTALPALLAGLGQSRSSTRGVPGAAGAAVSGRRAGRR